MTSYVMDHEPSLMVNATTATDLENFPLLMPRWGYVASAFILFLIGFFGFFLNLLVIMLMFKDRQLWTPLNIILFNLVCADFSVSVLGNPFTLVSALFHHWIFGHTLCVLYGFFMALLGITSITTLTVISFERYLLVTRPLSSRRLSRRGAALSVLLIWAYALALTAPPLLGWGNYINEAANISCSINWHEQSLNSLTYILFLFAFGQIVPTAVITFSYVNIIRTMKQNSKRLNRVCRAEGRATAMVFVMIVAFTVAWTPYSIFALMEQFATDGIVSPGAGVIPALVAKSSICYNPLIYVGMNTQFRKSIKVIFGIHSTTNNSQVGTMNNTRPASHAHKMTCSNDATTNLNVSECNTPAHARKRDKIITNHIIDVKKKDASPPNTKNITLHAVMENGPGNTNCNEDCTPTSDSPDDKSSELAIRDSDTTAFAKKRKHDANVDHYQPSKNVYGNLAYEEHSTDEADQSDKGNVYKRPKIIHSYSLDLIKYSASDRKIKTLSGESRLFGYFERLREHREDSVVTICDQSSNKKQARFRSYLCMSDNDTEDGIHIDDIV